MSARSRRSATLLVSVLALQLGIAAGPVRSGSGPTLWTYPGGCAGGATTLQGCIDNADPGDAISIETNGPIAVPNTGSISIDKSLGVFAAPGFHPTIDGGVGIVESAVATLISVSGLAFAGRVRIDMDTSSGPASGHVITLDRISAIGDTSQAAVDMDIRVATSVTVTNSTMQMPGFGTGIFAYVGHASGQTTLRFIGNRISAHGNENSGSGINIAVESPGPMRADVYSNSIWDVAACDVCSEVSGITLQANGDSETRFNIVGNSIHRSRGDGLRLANQQDEEPVVLNVFDNVFSRATQSAIELDNLNDAPLRFRAGSNAFFANGAPDELDGNSLGSGNITSNPRYIDASTGDLRLQSTSPLVDRGLVCNAGGLENLDAAGHGRLAGASVDIGAYERGAGAPTGEAFMGTGASDSHAGTNGADILCGFGGPDNLFGEGGRDHIDGGRGPDLIFGELGADRLFGDAGNDTLCARDLVTGNDRLDGGTGDDGFRADQGDIRIAVEHLGNCQAN